MKTFVCVLVALLSMALAAPFEDRETGVKGQHLFHKHLFFDPRYLSTSTLAPEDHHVDSDEPKDVSSTVMPSEETSTSNDDGLSVSGLNPALTGANEGQNPDPQIEQAATEVSKDQIRPDETDDAEKRILEQKHDHSHSEENGHKEDDKKMESDQHTETDQHDEEASASEDSYHKIDDSPKDKTSMETETEIPESSDESGSISRDLKPPHEGSFWGDFHPIVEDQEDVANGDNPSKTGGDETRIDDAIYKKPTDTGNDMFIKSVKGARFTPRWMTT